MEMKRSGLDIIQIFMRMTFLFIRMVYVSAAANKSASISNDNSIGKGHQNSGRRFFTNLLFFKITSHVIPVIHRSCILISGGGANESR